MRAMPRMSIAEIEALMAQEFPEARAFGRIEALDDRELTLRMPYQPAFQRPGGTVSGPALMTLADTAAYFLVLAMHGPVALAVTSSLEIHFLAKAPPADVLGTATMLKLGRRLAVTTVAMRSVVGDVLVAHATVTYALPDAG